MLDLVRYLQMLLQRVMDRVNVDTLTGLRYCQGVKVIRWIIQNALVLLLVGGIVAYFGYTQIKGKCPLCVVLEKIDGQTSAAGK